MLTKLGKYHLDLLLLAFLILVQFFLVGANITNVVRMGIGFLFAAFIPGYLLLTLLLDIGRVAYISLSRLVLSVPTSLAISVLIGLASITVYPASISAMNQTILIGIFDVVVLFAVIVRRTSRGSRFRGRGNLWLFLITLLVIIPGFLVAFPIEQEKQFISMYITDQNGKTDDFPLVVEKSQPTRLILGGQYRGANHQELILSSSLGDERIILVSSPEDTWSIETEVSFADPGLHKVEWELRALSPNYPVVRTVSIWLIVR